MGRLQHFVRPGRPEQRAGSRACSRVPARGGVPPRCAAVTVARPRGGRRWGRGRCGRGGGVRGHSSARGRGLVALAGGTGSDMVRQAPAETSHTGLRQEVKWLPPRSYRLWRNVGLCGFDSKELSRRRVPREMGGAERVRGLDDPYGPAAVRPLGADGLRAAGAAACDVRDHQRTSGAANDDVWVEASLRRRQSTVPCPGRRHRGYAAHAAAVVRCDHSGVVVTEASAGAG